MHRLLLAHISRRSTRRVPIVLLCCLVLVTLLFAACGGSTTPPASSGDASLTVPVNGFGVAANHVHSMLVLPDHVVLLATHYGFFRSTNDGQNWTKVAAGPHQPMYGSMSYSLTQSPLNPRRFYVLTLPSLASHDTLGLYTSADEGQTWSLASAATTIPSSYLFFVAAGNQTPDQLYLYLPDHGTTGLWMSTDDGRHFAPVGKLPFGNLLGLLAIPGAPGHLLAYGDDGVASSSDGGQRWQTLKGISGGVSDMVTAEPGSPIYASGDAGVMVSTNGGATFHMVNDQASYAALTMSPTQPQVLYGKTGLAVYRSSDGGRTWQALPHISGNLAVLAVDPANPSQVFLSLSYPTAVYVLRSSASSWLSLTPTVKQGQA